MIMKRHALSPYVPYWFWGQGHGVPVLGIENNQGYSIFIQRVFTTRLFASLVHPLLVFFFRTDIEILLC